MCSFDICDEICGCWFKSGTGIYKNRYTSVIKIGALYCNIFVINIGKHTDIYYKNRYTKCDKNRCIYDMFFRKAKI